VQVLSGVAIIAGSPASIAAEGFEIRSPNLASYLARQEATGGEELYFCVAHSHVSRGELMSRRTPLFTDIVCVRPGEAELYENSDYNLLSYEGQLEQGWTIFYKTAKLGSPALTPSRHDALSAQFTTSAVRPVEKAMSKSVAIRPVLTVCCVGCWVGDSIRWHLQTKKCRG
jgi:hypothetical protein